jgi:hypothetical protein
VLLLSNCVHPCSERLPKRHLPSAFWVFRLAVWTWTSIF